MTVKKFFIVGPAWVGDIVMAQSLFKVIKRRYPGSTIDVLAPQFAKPLLDRMPEVNQVIESPFSHGQLQLRKRYQFAQSLRDAHYERAIVLKNSFKSALIPFWAKIPHRIGWRGEMRFGLLNEVRLLDKEKWPLMIQRFMVLALPKQAKVPVSEVIYPKLNVTAETQSATLKALSLLVTGQPILVLCPGAEYGSAKRWPAKHFAAVANEKIAEGWQVYLLGSKKDASITAEIQQQTQGRCIDLAGKTTLDQAVDLLSLAQWVVTNDSGLMHVASALSVPTVAIYGSSSPAFTPPLSHRVKILTLNMACSPCFKRACPFDHLKCLNDVRPEWVLENGKALLSTKVAV